MKFSFPLLVLILMLTSTCSNAPTGDAIPEDTVNLEQVEQTLRQMTRQWYQAETDHDVDSYMSYIAENCVVHQPGTPPLVGKEAIRQAAEAYIDSLVSVTDNIERIAVASSGDMAYQIGDQQAVMKGPDGEMQLGTKYVVIWQKLEGKWQCVTMSVT